MKYNVKLIWQGYEDKSVKTIENLIKYLRENKDLKKGEVIEIKIEAR